MMSLYANVLSAQLVNVLYSSMSVACSLFRTYECEHSIVTIPLGVLKKSANLFTPFLDEDKVRGSMGSPQGRDFNNVKIGF